MKRASWLKAFLPALIALFLLLAAWSNGNPRASAAPTATVHVEPELLAEIQANGEAGYLLYFAAKADLTPAHSMDWNARGHFVMNTLRATAEASQKNVRLWLDQQGVSYKHFWIDNIIVVESSGSDILNGLRSFPEIASIRAEVKNFLILPEQVDEKAVESRAPNAPEPNLVRVKATDAWALGYRGQGSVIANIDSGVRHSHQALVNQYRGNMGGGVFNHNFNWLDPDGGSATPIDANGHGTHVMGTMVGDDGGANEIGVAPDSEWIACRGCLTSSCPQTALLACAQWVAAPHPIGNPGGANPDLRPFAVNNSWGSCEQSYNNWYQGVVNGWHAAGVIPVFANGNASNCGYSAPPGLNTVGNPARYGNVTGVGSSGTSNGQYASHSNWGPTDNPDTVNPQPGWANLKPQVIAPGVNIRSSVPSSDSAYQSSGWTGTSMSAPHVTGMIALMWQAGPCLMGDYAATETLIEQTATPILYNDGSGARSPNYATGWGEINVLAAVQAAEASCGPFLIRATQSSVEVCTGDTAAYNMEAGGIDFEGTIDLSVSGAPAGALPTLTPAMVTIAPAGTWADFVLEVDTTGVAPGVYTLTVTGVDQADPDGIYSVDVELVVAAEVAAGPILVAPVNGAMNVPAMPEFSWQAVDSPATYTIEVATDAGFTNIVATASGIAGTSWTSNVLLNTSTVHYWRVRAENACGMSAWSQTWMFTTVAAPGDCGPGTMANILYQYGFESGAEGWTTPPGVGTNTWAILTANPYEGANHYRGVGTASVTDQRLVSPAVLLPVDQEPIVLKFWHAPNLENNGATACYDGGILEVSADGGATWSQVPNANLLVGGYTGAISGSFGNPLAGLQAWCSPVTTTYRQTIADVSSYAGQTVQFRMRIGTDSSVSRPGWDVDAVTVQSCQLAGEPNIVVNPLSMVSTQDVEQSTEHALTISNTGTALLIWQIVEQAGVRGPQGEICTSPVDIAWLSVNSMAGSTPAGGMTPLQVAMNSHNVALGTHEANLCIQSNDPTTPPGNQTQMVIVPVMMVVSAPLSVGLSSAVASGAMVPVLLLVVAAAFVLLTVVARRRHA